MFVSVCVMDQEETAAHRGIHIACLSTNAMGTMLDDFLCPVLT